MHALILPRSCGPSSPPIPPHPTTPRTRRLLQINFKVTQKGADKKGFDWVGLSWCWPYLAYYMIYFSSVGFFIATAIQGWYSPQQLLLNTASVLWGALICISGWPPVAELLPRAETEQGWKVLWRPLPLGKASWSLHAGGSAAAGKDATAVKPGGRAADVRSRDAPIDSAQGLMPSEFVLLPHFPGGETAAQPSSKERLYAVRAKGAGKAPAGQLQYSVNAVPSFEQRQKPQRTLAFQLISIGMVACLLGSAAMDYLLSNRILVIGA
jgi:hypothetical protein